MKAITLNFASFVLLLSMITLLWAASANNNYRKTQLDGHLPQKPMIPKAEYGAYEKNNSKVPTKPVLPKEESGVYEKRNPKLPTKPVVPKEEYGAYDKSNPKVPTKPMIPKEEHEAYGKSNPKVPTKPVILKEKFEAYEKSNPKVSTKPVIPKEKYESYEKSTPKVPTKPVIPKDEHTTYEKSNTKIPKAEHGAYGKSNPKIPTKPVIPKEEHVAYGKSPKLPVEPVIPKEDNGAYGKSNPKIPTPEKPVLPKVPEHPHNIAVQGLIFCKYGSKLIPLKGATVRVTCLAVHKNGYEAAPFSFSSCPADVKGYFLAKISSSELLKDDLLEVKECKSFLENSPWTSCKVPEDTNGGITGAHLTFSRMLNGYSLSSVGPFIYSPGPQPSLPKEGY